MRAARPIPVVHLLAALAAGVVLRLFFAMHFPFVAGDTKFYEELARNWLYHHVYGLWSYGQLLPADVRMPGYPAFLAAVYALFGARRTAVTGMQIALDLGTCLLASRIAARIAPASYRRRAAVAALWLAALCPFTANYAGVVLTESLATFVTTLAIFYFVLLLNDLRAEKSADRHKTRSEPANVRAGRRTGTHLATRFAFGGLLVGLATLVRPETPLLLAAVAAIVLVVWRRRADWSKLTLACACMAVGLLGALEPWAARNASALGRVEFLSPRYAQTAGDFIPTGYYAWTRTWMAHFGDSYTAIWRLGREPLALDLFPAQAFDSESERAQVATLVAAYNRNLLMSPALDGQFARLARGRTERHPLRTHLRIPLERALAIWFTPRIELLPYSGRLWPPARRWHDSPADFSVTLVFGLLAAGYVLLAAIGVWVAWRGAAPAGQLAVALIIAYCALRTAVLTQLQTVEPRYVIECFPAVLAIAAQPLAAAFYKRGGGFKPMISSTAPPVSTKIAPEEGMPVV